MRNFPLLGIGLNLHRSSWGKAGPRHGQDNYWGQNQAFQIVHPRFVVRTTDINTGWKHQSRREKSPNNNSKHKVFEISGPIGSILHTGILWGGFLLGSAFSQVRKLMFRDGRSERPGLERRKSVLEARSLPWHQRVSGSASPAVPGTLLEDARSQGPLQTSCLAGDSHAP